MGGRPLTSVQQYKEDNITPWMTARPLCDKAYWDYLWTNDIPLTGKVSWANIPNLADTIIRTQKAQVDVDFMIRYLSGRFYKGEINLKLDEVNQARKEKWKGQYKSPGMEAHLKQWLEARKRSRTPPRPKVPDPMAAWRKRCAADGWYGKH